MAAEYPPLGKSFVLSYSNNDRDFPIVAIRKDPRVDNYRIPEDLSPHPDSKRWPNHVFTGAQPTNSDERVQWIYEILPSPWVPFTRYDDDLGPIQGRRRSVKNDGQVASLSAEKRTTYEAREGSAIVYTELEETWSIKTDEDGNSLFPIRDRDFYDASRGPVQERRQLFVPTGEEEGSLENVNGVITQTSYEPYNEFLSVKIVQTYKVDGPQLVGKTTDNDGQLVTVTTQRKGADGYVPPNPTATRTVEVSREDAESLVERIVDTPEVFKANTFSVERPDPIPQKFRVAVPIQSSQEIVEGEADPNVSLSTGELSKTEEQRNKFIKRVSTTSRDQAVLPKTLTGKATDNDRQEVTITETLQLGDTNEVPTATKTVESEDLGDGNYVVRKTEIPAVFGAETFRKTREDLTPQKFKAAQEDSTTEQNVAGIASSAITLATGEFAKSEQQINKFVKRVSTTSRSTQTSSLLNEFVLTPEGQVGTRTLTLASGDQSFDPSATLIDASVEALGDGRTVKTETTVPTVFSAKQFQQRRNNLTPTKFLTYYPESTEEKTIEGTAEQPSLNNLDVSKTEQQLTNFVKRISETKRKSPFRISKIQVLNGGAGYSSTPNVNISPVNEGDGSGATATAILQGNSVKEVTITNGGEGYLGGAIVSFEGGSPTKPAIAIAKVSSVEIEEEFLNNLGQKSKRVSQIVPKKENESVLSENPFLLDATSEITNVDELAVTQSYVGKIEPLPNFQSKIDNIPSKFKAEAGVIVSSEVIGRASQPVIDKTSNVVEETEQQVNINKKRITGTVVGKYTGALKSLPPISSTGSGYSDQTTLIVSGGSGNGAVLEPIIENGKIIGMNLLSGGYGWFEDFPTIVAVDYKGTGSGFGVGGLNRLNFDTRSEKENPIIAKRVTLQGEVYTTELGGGRAQIVETYGPDGYTDPDTGEFLLPLISPKFGTVSSEKENIGNGMFVSKQIDLPNPPELKGQNYDDTWDVSIPFTRQFLSPTTVFDARASVEPRDVFHSLVNQVDTEKAKETLLGVLYTAYDIQSVSLPDELKSATWNIIYTEESSDATASGNSATASTTVGISTSVDLVLNIVDGYRGPAPAKKYFFFLEKDNCTEQAILEKVGVNETFPKYKPKSHQVFVKFESKKRYVSLQLSLPNNRSKSQSTSNSTGTKIFTIPPVIASNPTINTSISGSTSSSRTITVSPPTGEGYTETVEVTVDPVFTPSLNVGTSIGAAVAGDFLYAVNVSPYRFGLVRVEAVVVTITNNMTSTST